MMDILGYVNPDYCQLDSKAVERLREEAKRIGYRQPQSHKDMGRSYTYSYWLSKRR